MYNEYLHGLITVCKSPPPPSVRPAHMSGLVRAEDQQQPSAQRGMTRLTSPEKWEIKQLIAAGVLDPSDYPGFDEETGILPGGDDPGSDEDIEIEIVDDEPVFLRGQTKLTVSISPVRIVKVRERSFTIVC